MLWGRVEERFMGRQWAMAFGNAIFHTHSKSQFPRVPT